MDLAALLTASMRDDSDANDPDVKLTQLNHRIGRSVNRLYLAKAFRVGVSEFFEDGGIKAEVVHLHGGWEMD